MRLVSDRDDLQHVVAGAASIRDGANTIHGLEGGFEGTPEACGVDGCHGPPVLFAWSVYGGTTARFLCRQHAEGWLRRQRGSDHAHVSRAVRTARIAEEAPGVWRLE